MSEYRLAIVSPNVFRKMQARAAIGYDSIGTMPFEDGDAKRIAGRFVTLARRSAERQGMTTLREVLQDLKPGDVREKIAYYGELAHVQVGDTVIVCGPAENADSVPVTIPQLESARETAARGAEHRRAIHEATETVYRNLVEQGRAARELEAATVVYELEA